jgi:isoaspartyl peptidase/L-asparaginase-like protein (Ntn-hydrolase superfamily)
LIAHGGVGSPPGEVDGCRAAVDAALRVIEAGGDPVEAAVVGVTVMEDDQRFNAGTGSIVRIDGETVQMDAAVMTSEGRFGAVAGVEEVKNPVRVAQAVLRTPHLLLAGDGATRFARAEGWEVRTAEAAAGLWLKEAGRAKCGGWQGVRLEGVELRGGVGRRTGRGRGAGGQGRVTRSGWQ